MSMLRPKTYVATDVTTGAALGSIPDALCLEEAADTAAVLLFSRKSARRVVASSSLEKGVFVAHGRCGWMRYPEGYVCQEIRFMLKAHNESERK